MKLCIVVSNFYPKVSNQLIRGALLEFSKKKIYKIKIIKVPGTYEIPFTISKLNNKYDGFVALGCIIKGQTPHFNYLCQAVFDALINLSINKKIPIGNGILTCNNKNQALKRADPKKINKGGHAALAAITLININKK